MERFRAHILVCCGAGCTSNSFKIMQRFEELLPEFGLEKEINVVKTGCFGLCAEGPVVAIYPEGTMYFHVDLDSVKTIVSEHLVKGNVVKELTVMSSSDEKKESNFLKKQTRVALRNCGIIDPENIEEYIAHDGYLALGRVLTEKWDPQRVIDEVKESGLRGRGGGGFPAGRKWETSARVKSDIKYVCCNADEGDPGAFMDRSILEGDPHSVLEAMAITGYAVGSTQGYIYVRAEYPIAVDRLNIAIDQARKKGFLGKNIFSSGFDFDIDIRLGAGAFVCGESTALMRSIEGKRGHPTTRPPQSAVKGLFQKPTILNNVETFANVPSIINKGAQWFSSMGTTGSKGTKAFALGGKVNNVGLVEIPMGTTLRDVVFDIGGGIPDEKEFKAVQTGGPSGGCIPASLLDTPIDYDNLIEAGSMMGSGGMIIMDEDDCMVDIAKFFLEFTVDESCGKCSPCRIGTKRMYEILTRITEGNGTLADLDSLKALAESITEGSLCSLGQSAANPILSTMQHFYDEYVEHVKEKKCRCHVCKGLLEYSIDPDICKKCSLCAKQCPVDAITGVIGKKPYIIDTEACIKCGACIALCKFNAIILQ